MYKQKYLKYKQKYLELLSNIQQGGFNIGQIVKLKDLTSTGLNGSYAIIKESIQDGRYPCFIIHKTSDVNLTPSTIQKIKSSICLLIKPVNIENCEELNNFDYEMNEF